MTDLAEALGWRSWDEWEFSPQPDITAYELAQILRRTTIVGSSITYKVVRVLSGGRPFVDSPELTRHYVYVRSKRLGETVGQRWKRCLGLG